MDSSSVSSRDLCRLPLEWTVGHAAAASAVPNRWVPATVPGAVQLDWARAEGWPEYWKADNFRAYGWMEDVWWTYRTRLPAVTVPEDQRLLFQCGGVDYHYEVLLDGRELYAHEGMFSPFELDLTEQAKAGALLEIRIRPAPKVAAARADRAQARYSAKPAVAYEWDWHPRLIPLGIWEDTRLVFAPAARITDVAVTYELDVAARSAQANFSIATTPAAEGAIWHWRVRRPDGPTIASGESVVVGQRAEVAPSLGGLELWWPHDQGAQPLYTIEFTLTDRTGRELDARQQRIGFRRAKLVMHEGAWDEPSGFPKSRSNPPFTLEINDRAIFCRGTNWVPPEIFPGTITRATYVPLLERARRANMNLLRSWGGGIINKESFFDLCDELGLMVWQEFPLACNCYPDDARYLRVLDAESRAIIKRLRPHASLVMWSGGNELFNSWSGMTDQSWALRLLNRNCYDLDPATPFIPTSPLDGVGHGDYRFRDESGREVHQIFAGAAKTAYTEFGCPGPSSVEYLKRFIPEPELWPVRYGTAWETHHGLRAWTPQEESSWLCPETIAHYFGEPENLEALVAGGQWLQSEGYKVLFEEARRQKPRSSMALNWCYNEPWPSAANNNLINWPCEEKPAFHAVASACRAVMPSAKIPKFLWRDGESFEAELWLFNDSPDALDAGAVEAFVIIGQHEHLALRWEVPASVANRHVRGPAMRFNLPLGVDVDRFTVRLSYVGRLPGSTTYTMPLRRAAPAR